jgi:hypothetical protein
MTTPAYPNDSGDPAPDYPAPAYPSPDHPGPEPNCDPDVLDDFACAAKGIAAQAAYNADHLQALDTARTQYNGARKAYGASGDAARPLVREAEKQLSKIIEQVECLIDDARVVRRLRHAFERVEDRLEQCGDQSGCYCRTDCDYDAEVRDSAPEDLASRIADIERRTKEAEDCFADLIQEPTKLTGRLTAVQAEVADVATKIGGNPETTDFTRLYAAALVARRHLSAVWRGFADVNAYIDCICGLLTCMLKGHAAIAELKRQDAVYQCHRDTEVAACTRLRTNTVDEVIAEYLKASAQYGDGESADYGDQGPEQQYDGDQPSEAEQGRYGDREGGDRGQYRDSGNRDGGGDRGQYPRTGNRPRGPGDYRGPDDERDRYGDRPRASGSPPR